jgi:CRP-like cAMP-binding protein
METTNVFFKSIYNHASFSQEEIDKIAKSHKKVEFAKGEVFLKIGHTANEFFILKDGLFRSCAYDFNGNEITTGFFVPGEIMIEPSSLFQRKPSVENHISLAGGIAWKIGYDDFQRLFHTLEGVREWGRSWMANQLFAAKQRLMDITTKSAAERYLMLLNSKPEVIKQAPLKYIASYLGITDTSLSRIRKEINSNKDFLS